MSNNSLFDAIILAGQQLANGGGGGGNGQANILTVAQMGQPFSVGQCVFNNNSVWTLSDNSNASTANVDGIITATTTNSFTVTMGGYQNTIGGLTANTQYYLGTAGGLITSVTGLLSTSFVVYIMKTGVAGDGVVKISFDAPLTTIGVPNGGTGAISLTGVLLGNGTAAFTSLNAITSIRTGTSAAMSSGTVTVSDTGCTSNSRYFFSTHSLGTVSIPSSYYASTKTPGTSFVITSSSAVDTSTIDWIAIN